MAVYGCGLLSKYILIIFSVLFGVSIRDFLRWILIIIIIIINLLSKLCKLVTCLVGHVSKTKSLNANIMTMVGRNFMKYGMCSVLMVRNMHTEYVSCVKSRALEVILNFSFFFLFLSSQISVCKEVRKMPIAAFDR
ncbi:hypothetical protein GJAV_G00143750 [Gymnothorax javanicus]|nr:hypothetical protein GJAV_G00143750 [Gymnothorax javanicus]